MSELRNEHNGGGDPRPRTPEEEVVYQALKSAVRGVSHILQCESSIHEFNGYPTVIIVELKKGDVINGFCTHLSEWLDERMCVVEEVHILILKLVGKLVKDLLIRKQITCTKNY